VVGPTHEGIAKVAMEANVSLPRVEYVWPGAVPYAQGDVELQLLARTLTTGFAGGGGRRGGPRAGGGGGGKTGRLEKRLVYDLQPAPSGSARSPAPRARRP